MQDLQIHVQDLHVILAFCQPFSAGQEQKPPGFAVFEFFSLLASPLLKGRATH
jgi:hypothetical protein